MNSVVSGNVITLLVLVIAIYTANWLNQRTVVKHIDLLSKRIDDLKSHFDARLDSVRSELRAELRAEIAPMRVELSSQGSRLERVERQLEAIFKPSLPRSGD